MSVAGRNAGAVESARQRPGFASAETGWQALIEREDIDLVDVCTPGDTHAEIAIAALRAGKHLLCGKPLANSVGEAEQMASIARDAAGNGVLAMCGFTSVGPRRWRTPGRSSNRVGWAGS